MISKMIVRSFIHSVALFCVLARFCDMFHASINEIYKILMQLMEWYRSEAHIFANNCSSLVRVNYNRVRRTTLYQQFVHDERKNTTRNASNILHGVINAIKMQVLRTLLVSLCRGLYVCGKKMSKNTEWVLVFRKRRGKIAWKMFDDGVGKSSCNVTPNGAATSTILKWIHAIVLLDYNINHTKCEWVWMASHNIGAIHSVWKYTRINLCKN